MCEFRNSQKKGAKVVEYSKNEFKISSSGNLPESERDGIPHYRNFKVGMPAHLPTSFFSFFLHLEQDHASKDAGVP